MLYFGYIYNHTIFVKKIASVAAKENKTVQKNWLDVFRSMI